MPSSLKAEGFVFINYLGRFTCLLKLPERTVVKRSDIEDIKKENEEIRPFK